MTNLIQGELECLALTIYFEARGEPDDADYVKPHWRSAFVEGPKIGRHIFYHVMKQAKAEGDHLQTATLSN
jgi:spore germination cell wall hydrolase CwlJ-like protein